MKKFTFVFIAVLAGLISTGCSEPEGYVIGDIGPSGVGIVFYITDGGFHGLEAAPEDQNGGAAVAWSNIIDDYANGSSALPSGIGTGLANTYAIIAQFDHTDSAAKICRDYKGGDFTDWFLPSADELNLLYDQKATFGNFYVADTYKYWTSSEQFEDAAQCLWFYNGESAYTGKPTELLVRAIRAF